MDYVFMGIAAIGSAVAVAELYGTLKKRRWGENR